MRLHDINKRFAAGVGAAALIVLVAAIGTSLAHRAPVHGDTDDRLVQFRIFEDGALLLSTWPDETGLLADMDDAPVSGPLPWAMREDDALWGPILPIFAHVPAGMTATVSGYVPGDLSLGETLVERRLELPLAGEVNEVDARELFGNVTAGSRRYFLGVIPVEIIGASEGGVAYRIALEEGVTLDVPRMVGLRVKAEPDAAAGLLQLTLHAPDGSFTAHKNCRIADQTFAAGHYVVSRSSPDFFELVQYRSPLSVLLQGRTLSVEATFSKSEPDAPPAENTHSM